MEYRPGHHINGSLPQGWDKNNRPNLYVEFSGIVQAKGSNPNTYFIKLDERSRIALCQKFSVLAIHDSNIRGIVSS